MEEHKEIPISRPDLSGNEIPYAIDALQSGWISSLGPYIGRFENEFAKFCQTRYAVAVSNGTTGLHLALLAAGIKAGDEVIVPNLTFVATINAVLHAGAVPVIADIEPDTLGIDAEKAACLVTEKTRAIIPVHLYGQPAHMKEISEVASKHDLVVIEDAAEAHGAEVEGKRVGSLGHIGVFSLYGNKIVTTGEGGMLTTDSEELASRARMLRDHAMSTIERYWHLDVGYNYRMTNIQAAIGVAQLERIDPILRKKHQIFEWYREELGALDQRLKLNRQNSWSKNVFWMICLEHDDLNLQNRKQFMFYLKEQGIDSRPYFYPLTEMPIYSNFRASDVGVSTSLFAKGINLPSDVTLSREDVTYVAASVKKALEKLFS
jgi:perosamine synthetase